MTPADWREGRTRMGLTQVQAAQQLGVSQGYLSQLERGSREAGDGLRRKAAELYRLPTALPLAPPNPDEVSADELQRELAAVGYPGFSYLQTSAPTNPAKVVYETVVKRDVDTRLVEALPWVLNNYPNLDWAWLRDQVKLRNAQNRLGYVVYLAQQVAADDAVVETLAAWGRDLEEARLAKEGTLCRDSMPEKEKVWLKNNRPEAAVHWSLLTGLTPDQLPYAKR